VQDVTSPYARSYWKLRNSLSIAQNLYRYHHRDLHIFAPLGSSIKASRISPCSIVKPLHSENGLDSSYCPKPCPATHPRFPSPLPVSEITQIHTAESHSFHVSHPHIVPTNPASLSLAQKKIWYVFSESCRTPGTCAFPLVPVVPNECSKPHEIARGPSAAPATLTAR